MRNAQIPGTCLMSPTAKKGTSIHPLPMGVTVCGAMMETNHEEQVESL
jgi:hypothetical protein